MSKGSLGIMIADKMPPPGSKGKADEYSGDDTGADDSGGGDEEMELATMADFRKCLRSGDDEGALGHLRDLVGMLSGGDAD